jgi:hypothetical protein
MSETMDEENVGTLGDIARIFFQILDKEFDDNYQVKSVDQVRGLVRIEILVLHDHKASRTSCVSSVFQEDLGNPELFDKFAVFIQECKQEHAKLVIAAAHHDSSISRYLII